LKEILTVMLVQLESVLRRYIGGFGYSEQNQEGEEILNFVVPCDLMVANAFFGKKKNLI
jgi:hypothetical protein